MIVGKKTWDSTVKGQNLMQDFNRITAQIDLLKSQGQPITQQSMATYNSLKLSIENYIANFNDALQLLAKGNWLAWSLYRRAEYRPVAPIGQLENQLCQAFVVTETFKIVSAGNGITCYQVRSEYDVANE